MSEQNKNDMDRRGFVAATAAFAVAASTAEAQAQVVEKNIDIKTPDGTSDAAFFHPATGTHPNMTQAAQNPSISSKPLTR